MIRCRSCDQPGLTTFLSLGQMPLADGLLKTAELDQPEARYPLEVAHCDRCSLVQILEAVPPEELFCQDYPYYSSFSDALLEHSRGNVEALIESRELGASSLVVELASNDGYLLQYYARAGIPVLGIDPADGPVAAARKKGIETICDFFGEELAGRLADEGRRADVIHANNVLAHVPDLNGFVRGIGRLLKDSGVAVIEVPYVRELIDHCEFDTIYHEHLCYFSVTALDHLFQRHGLWLNHVDRLSIHGGSLRLFVEPVKGQRAVVEGLLRQEREDSVDRLTYYQDFAARVEHVRDALRSLLQELKAQGKSIAGYGAAAKGAIMLNYVGIGREWVDVVVDRNVHKQGKHMPGVHIPIGPPELLIESMPDYVLLLPWNFKDEILAQQSEYRSRGGKFIVPIPSPTVV